MMNQSVKDRWKDPRGTIAQKYKNNDYGYVFHAGVLLFEFLRSSNFTVSDLKTKRILDYGCGTGRIARFLALSGAHVVGYDPTPECITEAEQEGIKTGISIGPRLFTSDLSAIGDQYDIVICINVLEHLTTDEFNDAIKNITNCLREGGECYLWVSRANRILPFKNPESISNPTGIFVAKGVKVDGTIPYYEEMN